MSLYSADPKITLHMADEDKNPTIEFLTHLHKKTLSEIFDAYRLTISDINYTTDPKDQNGVRHPHYITTSEYGDLNRPGVFIITKATFPYDWRNPSGDIEPGFIQISFEAIPADKSPNNIHTLSTSNDDMKRALVAYCRMIDAEYPGSHTFIVGENDEASFRIVTIANTIPDGLRITTSVSEA